MGSYISRNAPRLSQGDIYRNVRIIEGEYPDGLKQTSFWYSILLSQDCDLEQHWHASVALKDLAGTDLYEIRKVEDKVLRRVIMAPCYVAEAFKKGQHLECRAMQAWSGKEMEKLIRPNKHIRYHYLPRAPGLLEQDLIVDFKHYSSVERDHFYESAKRKQEFAYVCSVAFLYRDALSRRFGDYMVRIGLPDGDEVVVAAGPR